MPREALAPAAHLPKPEFVRELPQRIDRLSQRELVMLSLLRQPPSR